MKNNRLLAAVLIGLISNFDFDLFYTRGGFFSPVADLINRQLTTAECTACQPPLWLGRSPPFCGPGPLCPRFLLCFLHVSVSPSAWGCRGRRRRRKEGKPGEERKGVTKREEMLFVWRVDVFPSFVCVCEVEVLDICDILVLFATFICCLIYMRFYIQHEIKGAFLWCSLTHDEQKESKQLIIISRFMVLLSQTLMHD